MFQWASVICIFCSSHLGIGTPVPTPQQIAGMVWLATSGTQSSNLATIQIEGTAISSIGGEVKSGTIVLKSQGSTRSRVDLSFGGEQTTEIQNSTLPENNILIDSTGNVRQLAIHNTWSAATWFFPAFLPTALWNSSSVQFSLPAPADASGITLQSNTELSGVATTMHNLVERLSSVRYQLNPTTYLPSKVTFTTHPDADLNRDIGVEVDYSDYRLVDGVQVPFRIRKYLNGDLILDITVTNVIINPTLSDSDFQPK
jgi:hypothetical protein